MTDVNPKFVRRLAETYLEYYTARGFKEAKKYAERTLGDNEPLKLAVRAEADVLMAEMTRGK